MKIFLIIGGFFASIFHPHTIAPQPVIVPVVQVQQAPQVQTPTTVVPVVVSKAAEKPKITIPAPTIVPPQQVITPVVTTAPVTMAQDHCINLPGVQPALPDGMQYNVYTHYCDPIPVPPTAEELQQQAQSDYNAKIKTLQQQILDIKAKYYQDYDNLKKVPSIESQFEGNAQNLLNTANEKIDQINLQIQQLQLDN